MQKKILFPTVGLLIAAAIVFWIWQAPATPTNESNTNSATIIGAVVIISPNESTTTNYDATVTKGTNGFVALQEVAQEHNITIKTTTYDFGELVTSIDGVGDDTSEGKYWSFYVNDTLSDVGATAYEVKGGDQMLWKYQAL